MATYKRLLQNITNLFKKVKILPFSIRMKKKQFKEKKLYYFRENQIHIFFGKNVLFFFGLAYAKTFKTKFKQNIRH